MDEPLSYQARDPEYFKCTASAGVDIKITKAPLDKQKYNLQSRYVRYKIYKVYLYNTVHIFPQSDKLAFARTDTNNYLKKYFSRPNALKMDFSQVVREKVLKEKGVCIS